MRTFPLILLGLAVSLPAELHAFFSYDEMSAESLREDPSIKIRIGKLGEQFTFIVALRARADNPEVYWHGSLDLVAQDGTDMGRIEMRGEDVRRALDEETLRAWGWQKFKPAEVFRFTVASSVLKQSKFTWETGPRNDEHGIPYGGGIIRWSFLQALADAAENANRTGAASGSQPTGVATNRTPSAADSRR